MSWFQALATSDRLVILVPKTGDTTWLQPGQDLFTNTHKKLTVVGSTIDEAAAEPQLRVTITKALSKSYSAGDVIWFTFDKNLANEAYKAAKQSQQQNQGGSAYPDLWGGERVDLSGAGGGAASSSSGGGGGGLSGFPGLSDNDSNSSRVSVSRPVGRGGRSKIQSSSDSRRDEPDFPMLRAMETDSFAGDNEQDLSNYDVSGERTESKNFCTAFWFMLILHSGVLAGNLYLCRYIGSFRTWTAVIGYVFIGYQAMAFVSSLIVYCITNHFFYKQMRYVNLALVIVNFVLVLAIGIPAAWAEGRMTAAANWLDKPMTQTVNCYRQPNMTFSQFSASFIVFSEAAWEIDYQSRHKQKVVADLDPGDPQYPTSYPKVYYNYLVAPMRYTGNAPCHVKIYAACFQQQPKLKLTSLDFNGKDARACGWHLPVTGVVMRIINNNEAFFNFANTEDAEWWQKAWQLTGEGRWNTSVFAWFGGETPNDMMDEYDKAQEAADKIEICYYALGIPMLAIIAFIVTANTIRGGGGSCCSSCSDCCD